VCGRGERGVRGVRAWPARRASPRATGRGKVWGSAVAAVWDARQRLIVRGAGAACVVGAACVAAACVAAACVAATCVAAACVATACVRRATGRASGGRASGGRGAVRQQQ